MSQQSKPGFWAYPQTYYTSVNNLQIMEVFVFGYSNDPEPFERAKALVKEHYNNPNVGLAYIEDPRSSAWIFVDKTISDETGESFKCDLPTVAEVFDNTNNIGRTNWGLDPR